MSLVQASVRSRRSALKTLPTALFFFLTLASSVAHADFSLGGVLGDTVKAVSSGLGQALDSKIPGSSGLGTQIGATVGDMGKAAVTTLAAEMDGDPITADGTKVSTISGPVQDKPAGWPSGVRWFNYSQNAPQPVYTGKVRKINIKGFSDGADWNSLPLQYAIVRVHGNGKRKIAMFVDPRCVYSKRMEQALNKIDNVTIYTFVAPFLWKESADLTQRIQCQPTNQARAQAYDRWMLLGEEPAIVAPCQGVADRVIASWGNTRDSRGNVYNQHSPFTVWDNDLLSTGGLELPDVLKLMNYSTGHGPVAAR